MPGGGFGPGGRRDVPRETGPGTPALHSSYIRGVKPAASHPPPPAAVSSSSLAAAPSHAASLLDALLQPELDGLAAHARLRVTRSFPGGDRTHQDGQPPLTAFCSNDYLGLAGHPALAQALSAAATAGTGAGASRLVNGETPAHLALEARLASFVQRPAALLFPTGYLANLGVVTALAGPSDLIVSDAANHASLIDGCRLSRARIQIYPHGDSSAAAQALSTPGVFRRRFLLTESIFSMDGDRAPLPALARAAQRNSAILIVDEAHALGVAGPGGRGVCAAMNVSPDILVGTLGKAFGTAGGFVSGSTTLRSYLVNRCRPFIYSTAPSPALAAASVAGVDLAAGPEGDQRRTRATQVASRLRVALASAGHPVPGEDLILPLVIGSDQDAVALSKQLLERGFLVPAIRPPTVPEGTARLRITASAAHTDGDVDSLLAALLPLLASRAPA